MAISKMRSACRTYVERVKRQEKITLVSTKPRYRVPIIYKSQSMSKKKDDTKSLHPYLCIPKKPLPTPSPIHAPKSSSTTPSPHADVPYPPLPRPTSTCSQWRVAQGTASPLPVRRMGRIWSSRCEGGDGGGEKVVCLVSAPSHNVTE